MNKTIFVSSYKLWILYPDSLKPNIVLQHIKFLVYVKKLIYSHTCKSHEVTLAHNFSHVSFCTYGFWSSKQGDWFVDYLDWGGVFGHHHNRVVW